MKAAEGNLLLPERSSARGKSEKFFCW